MKNLIDITKLKTQDVDLELLKMRISTGRSIMFSGAGFSFGTKNITNEKPPLAKELAKNLCSLAKIEESENLMFAADVALEYGSHDAILELLKDKFTLKETSSNHETICNLPWKRFYTTNYDNSIELSSLKCGKRIESIDLSSQPIDYIKKKNICIHINGKVEGAIPSDLTSKIKLSDSSYLSADSFTTSKWYYHFKHDLDSASAIVFIGYSMYDLDVKKFLFENPALSEKTHFIIRDGADFSEKYLLRKFGHILAIGIDNFADLVKDINSDKSEDIFLTESIQKYEFINTNDEIRDIDCERLFLYGDYESKKLQKSLSNLSLVPYFIKRDIVLDCINDIKNKLNVLLLGDLGNGKSILVEMLAYELSMNGYSTYIINDNGGDYIKDFDEISKYERNAIIIIDDFSNYIDLLKHIKEVGIENIQLILAGRSINGMHDLISADTPFNEHHIDALTDNEIHKAISIIDNLAAWQEFSNLSQERKFRLVKDQYNSQLSLILLGLLNSPNIKNKIREQTAVIYENEEFKKTVFCICICEISNVNPSSSIISEISGSNAIYNMSLRSQPEFNQLFRLNGTSIKSKSKSSILALSLLNNTFDELYITNMLLDIEKRIDNYDHQENELKKIFKSLLRFHVVERILPQRKSSLDRYYEQIKIRCSWLTDSPHYWVQYAMCRLAFSDFPRAQKYLNEAYTKAQKKTGSYHTDNIDTQQARLYLNQCLDNSNSVEAFKLFDAAHKLLEPLPVDGQKFRQVLLYEDVFNTKYKHFSPKNKVGFEQAIKKILLQINDDDIGDNIYSYAKQAKFIYLARDILNDIVEKIQLQRNK